MSERTTVEILKAARKRITPKGRWTRGTEAVDSRGACVDATASSAVAWCMAGAVRAEGGDPRSFPPANATPVGRILNTAIEQYGRGQGYAVGPFNDSHTHAEVLAALDRAIELAEAEPK